MKHRSLFGMAVLMALCLAGNAGSAELVKSFSGSGSSTTAEFEVRPLDSRLACQQRISQDHGGGDPPGRQSYRLSPWPDFGTRCLARPCAVSAKRTIPLQVSATLSEWNLKVEELSPEEVELYTPRQ